MKKLNCLIAIIALMAIGNLSFAQEKSVTVGGAPMYPSKNIIENAVNSKDHTTLVAAVKAAGLVETLSGAPGTPTATRCSTRSSATPPV